MTCLAQSRLWAWGLFGFYSLLGIAKVQRSEVRGQLVLPLIGYPLGNMLISFLTGPPELPH